MAAPRTALTADLALSGAVLVWGATFVIVQRALADASTLLFLALRFTLAAAVLAVLYRGVVWSRSMVYGGALCGTALFAGFLLQTAGLRYTTASKSAFLTGLSVVLVPLLGTLVERRPPRLLEAAGVVLAAAGMALLTLRRASLDMGYGDLLTLACALAFAVHILLVSRFVGRVGFRALVLVQTATAAALSLATFWWAEPVVLRWTPGLAAAVLVTGLLATALAFSVMAWSQQRTSATHVALICSMEPVFAAGASYLAMGEAPSAQGVTGAALILAGVLIVELRTL